MVERAVTVALQSGLHARPAATFVQLSNRYQSEISLVKGEKTVNAKSILGILSLACTKGSQVKVVADGVDEQEALHALTVFLETEELPG
ncbi:HPr family phosphocarrier protein [Alicyclobacillus cycloheptanicus]|uniref:Phosphocarrier protein HPr n=1 Tax=Alicyclobacillus cycloheptanicus TaxID=1457 RepID=A0ABT9XLN4_9BACL|nr:HPr family phosphocarrier protein [Alicyclobacillus cycloheptanicus]MDQ0191203.1 phosphotransferase system HPr (HPr) family protein [Alicyclobacillus cycloheptanicus]WDM02117.1 HPr family phosphocarrier protein [Alicyclobacillus cycloheptanicus]